jgi:hypothetical protein
MFNYLTALVVGCLATLSAISADEGPAESQVAAAVDEAILRVLNEEQTPVAPAAGDEDFLRRVYLDLAGTIPTPSEVTLFGLDTSPDKRTAKIEELLAGEGFASNWAAYLREVFFARATDMRARLAQTSFESWLKQQLEQNSPWDETARAILTATGDVTAEGPTGFLFAHFGDPSELAGETARIFLGIQISCANCHDHPYDSWKREQFHELAAFFPRVQVRQEMSTDRRTFIVASNDVEGRRGQGLADFSRVYARLDLDRNGRLTREEAAAQDRVPVERLFELGDADEDGMLSLEEAQQIRPPMNQPGRGTPEHYMPDLENPQARGTLMQPVFFVNGDAAEIGDTDQERRDQLADFITSPDNPWFAKAFVNRIWTEMLGEGFFPLVDDMGPERTPVHGEALELLSQGFIDSGYDVQWLFRTIALTEAYQREMRHSDPTESLPPFAAARPTRLRADQLYNALTQVLGANTFTARNVPRRQFGQVGADVDVGRLSFTQLFGFDPSTPQSDLLGTIPQALLLMNSRLVENLIDSARDTRLRQLLREFDNDEDALEEIYLLILSRQPTDDEREICLAHIEQVSDRNAAFEDIFWSLLNSTEFLTKR